MEEDFPGDSRSNAISDNKRADLQGLRGLAILFVLVMHLRPTSYRLGFVGVDIFFVLSGFLMAKILLEKNFTIWFVWRFYTRRFKRIVPLYMLLVVAVYVYGYFYVLRPDRKQILDDLAWVYTYSFNLQPIFEKLGYWDQLSTYRFFVHTWSLGVELQYYLIVPVVMGIAFCCKHHVRLILFLSLGIFSIIFQLYEPPKISYGFLLSRIWQFMSGSIAYEFSKTALSSTNYELLLNRDQEGTLEEKAESYAVMGSSKNRRISNSRFLASLFANAFLLVLVMLVAISPKSVSDDTARICSTAIAGVVVYLNTDVFCLTNVLITYCGDISYVLYLVHWPIIVTVRYITDSQTLNAKAFLLERGSQLERKLRVLKPSICGSTLYTIRVATVLFISFALSVATHHTFEKFFMKRGIIVAFICVIACYACILGTKSMYLYAPPLESIDPNTSKIEYAIEWNMRESHKVYYAMPCSKDVDTERYTNFTMEPQLRCVAKGNGTAVILLVGNSIAYRAYPLFHDLLKGRYRDLRLYSRSSCPPLSNLCPDFTEAMKKVVQHEKPDILWDKNLTVLSNYTNHIVIDMPYYKAPFNAGVRLAKRLQFGLPLGDELVVTWQQHVDQTQYHRLRLSSIQCSECIMNDINEALFKDGLFYLYDPKTFLVRLGDGLHMTPVGLELLRPLYTKIMDKLLQMLHN